MTKCFYFNGGYDSGPSFAELHKYLNDMEKTYTQGANRIYYFAIPPTVFVASGKSIKENSMSTVVYPHASTICCIPLSTRPKFLSH